MTRPAAVDVRDLRSAVCSRPFILAVVFCLALCVFEATLLPTTLGSIALANHIENENYFRLLLVVSLSIIATAVAFSFYFFAFASSWPWRIAAFLLFSFVTIVEYSHYYAFARFSDFYSASIGLFIGDWGFVSDAARIYFNPLALIPIAVFGVFVFSGKRLITNTPRAIAAIAIPCVVFFALSAYFSRNTYYAPSTSAAARTIVGFPVIWYVGAHGSSPRSERYASSREAFEFRSDQKPKNNIVLIIDESVRGDYLSINGYGKPTTIALEELSRNGKIANWGIAAAGSTCSINANNLILTGLTELPDTEFKLLSMPTIFQYAKAMNYENYYIDGQASEVWNGIPADREDFGYYITADELRSAVGEAYDIDKEVARRVRSIVTASTGNFIWVNKLGVHKPYSEKYPGGTSDGDGWGTNYGDDTSREQLINAYEQALSYNSQIFFSELFSEGTPPATYFIYTSDHGQTLRENGETSSHCAGSRNEAVVPMMLIGNDAGELGVDVGFKASHANIFPTILDLMKFPIDHRRHAYAISLLSAKTGDSTPRFYTAGDLHGVGSTKRYVFD